ncbi:ATPase [Campylobacter ureolyticus]|nr:ATPase [Campylobacter ureolyticus]
MIIVYVVCEGQTEEEFIKTIFAKSFDTQKFYIQPLIIPTSKNSKGGALSYDRVKILYANN